MSKSPVKVGIASLGCCKNQVDAEIMLRALVDGRVRGHPLRG